MVFGTHEKEQKEQLLSGSYASLKFDISSLHVSQSQETGLHLRTCHLILPCTV